MGIGLLSILTRGSAKGADARRQTEKELREALGGEPETATVLREFLESIGNTKWLTM